MRLHGIGFYAALLLVMSGLGSASTTKAFDLGGVLRGALQSIHGNDSTQLPQQHGVESLSGITSKQLSGFAQYDGHRTEELMNIKYVPGYLEDDRNLQRAAMFVYPEDWAPINRAENEFEKRRRLPEFKQRLQRDVKAAPTVYRLTWSARFGDYDFGRKGFNVSIKKPSSLVLNKLVGSVLLPISPSKAEQLKHGIRSGYYYNELIFDVTGVGMQDLSGDGSHVYPKVTGEIRRWGIYGQRITKGVAGRDLQEILSDHLADIDPGQLDDDSEYLEYQYQARQGKSATRAGASPPPSSAPNASSTSEGGTMTINF